MIRFVILASLTLNLFSLNGSSQSSDTLILKKVTINGIRTVNGIGHMNGYQSAVIYAGKKNEILLIDSINANKAINNTRQILGRIPGLNITETESGGFTANGIATRGLNPIQSTEMNIRQNGYNISADIFGYNEAYYVPPMEAVSRIEMIRGAASLQFGPQFGGLANYVLQEPDKNKKWQWKTAETAGSFGLINFFNSVSISNKKMGFYGYFQDRKMDGYRPNSFQKQLSGFGSLNIQLAPNLSTSFEYSLLRNKIQMPGGLTDSMFYHEPKTSTRGRNWLKSPWNILNNTIKFNPSSTKEIVIKNTFIFSNRSLVWKNEDGGPELIDEIDASGNYSEREVAVEKMKSFTTEARLGIKYNLLGHQSTLAIGTRLSHGVFVRLGGGKGTNKSDYDLSISGPWGYDLKFQTNNLATFAENIFQLSGKLSITPGVRFEHIQNSESGYKTVDTVIKNATASRSVNLILSGIGIEFKPTIFTGIYANISQAFKPIEYAQLEPFGTSSKIDPHLKDATGFNADLGYRGVIKNFLNFDLSFFILKYDNRIGVVLVNDPVTNTQYSYRTNTATSLHKGIESYCEFNLLKYLNANAKKGLSIFNSFAFIDANYTSGPYKGNRVESACRIINRTGISYSSKMLSATFQYNLVGDAYGDASNVKISSNPIAGYIPAYQVADFSGSFRKGKFNFKAGVNNLFDKNYFTRRTDEYPGPGIIPSPGRSYYVGFERTFN
ncbi:MAG: TonB-dependent receptor [Ginsengibacter sp.]